MKDDVVVLPLPVETLLESLKHDRLGLGREGVHGADEALTTSARIGRA